MGMINRAYCSTCNRLVVATRSERDGKIYLVKNCPECGKTETLISSDAGRYGAKRSLDPGVGDRGCRLDCLTCDHGRAPNLVFVDVTNRCNLNCPVCINNTPSMGFLFEPPLEYFETIFKRLAAIEPMPSVQLFGGEPTVREDLFEIIRMARAQGLPTRVVTNGLKLADEAYCRRLIESRATILLSYDGDDRESYAIMRGSGKILDLKLQAIDNIAKIGKAKVTLMTLISKGFNERQLPDLFRFCHEHRQNVRAVYFIPLAHTWKAEDLALDPPRTTIEDIEGFVNAAFPGEHFEFLPAGFLGQIQSLLTALRVKPLPFAGAHPNCESIFFLISDGERFIPISHYLKGTVTKFARDMRAAADRLSRRPVDNNRAAGGFGKKFMQFRGLLALIWVLRRHARLGRLIKGKGLGKVYHALAAPLNFLLGRKSRDVLGRHLNLQGALQVVVLPFEDKGNLETERMERCPTAFTFYDPLEDKVKHVPTCAWGIHKTAAMRKVMEYYESRA